LLASVGGSSCRDKAEQHGVRPSCDGQRADRSVCQVCSIDEGVHSITRSTQVLVGNKFIQPLGRLGVGPIGANHAPPPVVRWALEDAMRTGVGAVQHQIAIYRTHFPEPALLSASHRHSKMAKTLRPVSMWRPFRRHVFHLRGPPNVTAKYQAL